MACLLYLSLHGAADKALPVTESCRCSQIFGRKIQKDFTPRKIPPGNSEPGRFYATAKVQSASFVFHTINLN